MIININDILKNPGFSKPLQIDAPPSDTETDDSVLRIRSAVLRGELRNRAGATSLNAVIEAEVQIRCARCDISFLRELSIGIDRLVALGVDDPENDDILVAPGGELDIGELIREELLLEAEPVYLCREDCKGLCPVCGTDLNEGSCRCSEKKDDPRFKALLDLFDGDE